MCFEISRSGVEAGPPACPVAEQRGEASAEAKISAGVQRPRLCPTRDQTASIVAAADTTAGHSTGSSSWHIRASSPRAGTGSLLWPRTNQPPLRRTARALTPTPSAVGHDRTTVHDANHLPRFEPTTPSILSNECIASSLVW
ncbi:hypothetical protein MRX96_006406 [Rhipicephalus microplus]